MAGKRYAEWNMAAARDSTVSPPTLNFDITLVSPSGEVLFRTTRSFDTGMAGRQDPKGPPGAKVISCSVLSKRR